MNRMPTAMRVGTGAYLATNQPHRETFVASGSLSSGALAIRRKPLGVDDCVRAEPIIPLGCPRTRTRAH